MTATLQFDPDLDKEADLCRRLEAPEKWRPHGIESRLYWQIRYGWCQGFNYWEGYHPCSCDPITTNSCSTAFS